MTKENQILDAIRAGDKQALEDLYLLHRLSFIKWAQLEFQCTTSDACELYQVAVLITYDNIVLGKLKRLHSTLKSYLFAVAKNKWKEWKRASYKTKNIADPFLLEMIMSPEEEQKTDPSAIRMMVAALHRLGQPCQELLECYYYQGLSMQEITEVMGYKNTSTAKNLKYKCLQRLKRMVINKLKLTLYA